MKKLSKPIFITFLSTIILSACGGGSSAGTDQETTGTAPVQITTESWHNTQARLTSNTTLTTKTYIRRSGGTRTRPKYTTYLRAQINGVTDNPAHEQFFIDIDNNPATGFKFANELWSTQSGIDYLIEDGQLYKSTANDSSWSWELITSVHRNRNRIDIKLSNQHAFEPLCKDFNIGYVELGSDWNVKDYFPKANHMSKQTVSFCGVYNEPPKITLLGNGLNSLVFEINDPLYADPGATASDLEDGDISSKIIVSSNVNIHKVGNYTITYEVKDSQGLTAKKTRYIRVVKPSRTGIVVDGKLDDWSTINPIVHHRHTSYSGHFSSSSGYYLKASDTAESLYFIADTWQSHSHAPASANGSSIGQNWQYFMDTDNNSATGYNGYDYLIENGHLLHFSGLSIHEWSWKQINTTDVSFARGFRLDRPTKGRVEVSVAKSLLPNLGDTMKIQFVSRDSNWQVGASFGNSYKLKTRNTINHPPIATNDNQTTYSAHPGTKHFIFVLENDSDPDGDALGISHVTQPSHGKTGISTAQGTPQKTVWYTPRTGFTGTDSFTYTIQDTHGNSATATVTLNVTQGNRAPNAVEDAPTTTSDTPIDIDVLANDRDPDGNPIRILSFTQPTYGVVTEVTLSCPSAACRRRHLHFDPQGHVGSISFSYTITDGRTLSPNHTDTAVVTVATTSPSDTTHTGWPVIKNETVTVKAGQSILISVLANDSDPDGDTLILDQVDSGNHGTTSKVSGNKVRYTPEAGFTGTDEFWYGVHDGHGHNGAGKVSITVIR